MSSFDFTPFGPGLSPTDISQVANDNFYRLNSKLQQFDSSGWISGALPAVSSVTYNGNRSYDITFNDDVSAIISTGMRLKTKRTVTAPTQCTSLNGSTQYWTKASPSGVTFTSTWTAMAWIKLTTYSSLSTGIIGRDSTAATGSGWEFGLGGATYGQLIMYCRNATGNIVATSYQAIPLNKWVHVAGTMNAATSSITLYIDGVAVPSSNAFNGTSVVQASTNLTVGWRNSTAGSGGYFPGKIAQVALFSSVLSQATIQSYISQGLTGSEPNLISAYSFNNSANDLAATGNNLSAAGSATATNSDSPYSTSATNVPNGTEDYGIVQKVATSVATISVPAGCTIPTSGGIAATYTSTEKNPYNWVVDKDRWELIVANRTLAMQSSPVSGTWYNLGLTYMTVPSGIWDLRYDNNFHGNAGSATTIKVFTTLSTSASAESDRRYTMDAEGGPVTAFTGQVSLTNTITLAAATNYYIITSAQSVSHNAIYNLGDRGAVAIRALPSGL